MKNYTRCLSLISFMLTVNVCVAQDVKDDIKNLKIAKSIFNEVADSTHHATPNHLQKNPAAARLQSTAEPGDVKKSLERHSQYDSPKADSKQKARIDALRMTNPSTPDDKEKTKVKN